MTIAKQILEQMYHELALEMAEGKIGAVEARQRMTATEQRVMQEVAVAYWARQKQQQKPQQQAEIQPSYPSNREPKFTVGQKRGLWLHDRNGVPVRKLRASDPTRIQQPSRQMCAEVGVMERAVRGF